MQIEDHLLWKITTTYDLLYRTRKKFTDGDLAWEEYAALMEPKCIEVMSELLKCVETGDFLDYHRRNRNLPDGNEYPGRGKYGYPFPSTSKRIIERYEQFVKIYQDAIIQTDPEKKTKELVIGFDSFAGWMHGSYEISRWIIKLNPITGDWETDYSIALDTMTIVTGFGNASSAIQYLRDCQRENARVKVNWELVRTSGKSPSKEDQS